VYEAGPYVYENNDLTEVEYINGVVINWSDDSLLTEERKEVIRYMISNLVRVDGGTFLMGAQHENASDANYDAAARSDESPVHEVSVSDFYMGIFEITQKEWCTIMDTSLYWLAEYGEGDAIPAYNVSREEALSFIERLNKWTKLSFQLPTEAQWEFAARGGNSSHHYRYSGSDNVDEVAWYNNNTGNILHNVGEKLPNELGIYDMSGSLWEWCLDSYKEYPSDPQVDPLALGGYSYVLRGGSWTYQPSSCRVTCRDSYNNYDASYSNGFRLALKIQ